MTRRKRWRPPWPWLAVGTGFALLVGALALDGIGNVLILLARAVGLR
ncbi:MAG TPA: hypothetical protein VIN75_26050 [Burkholderiaceae bacterium]